MAKRPKDPSVGSLSPQAGDDNPAWYKPVMFGLMLAGLVWILAYYISRGQLVISAVGSWNIAIGFGVMFVGFLMTTRWK